MDDYCRTIIDFVVIVSAPFLTSHFDVAAIALAVVVLVVAVLIAIERVFVARLVFEPTIRPRAPRRVYAVVVWSARAVHRARAPSVLGVIARA